MPAPPSTPPCSGHSATRLHLAIIKRDWKTLRRASTVVVSNGQLEELSLSRSKCNWIVLPLNLYSFRPYRFEVLEKGARDPIKGFRVMEAWQVHLALLITVSRFDQSGCSIRCLPATPLTRVLENRVPSANFDEFHCQPRYLRSRPMQRWIHMKVSFGCCRLAGVTRVAGRQAWHYAKDLHPCRRQCRDNKRFYYAHFRS